MATLSIRKLDDSIKASLRIRAANHGISMEEEARRILRNALAPASEEKKGRFGTRIHRHFAKFGSMGKNIIPPRSTPRAAPDFSEKTKK